MSQTLFYQAFGQTIQSDILLPELIMADSPISDIDVTIRYENLSRKLNEFIQNRTSYQIKKGYFAFYVPEVACFVIENGDMISVYPDKQENLDRIRLYVLGTCMGAILHQKQIVALHGSAIVIQDKAYAFVGDSGQGKSTLASAFIQQGYKLLTDDVIAIKMINDNPMVMPAYPQQKLWQESLAAFGMNPERYSPLFDRETKYAVPVSSNFINTPVPLAGVFELTKLDCELPKLISYSTLEGMHLLYRHTFRNLLLSAEDLKDWHFDASVHMVSHLGLYRLERPIHTFTANQLASLVKSVAVAYR
ncbi:aldolase [Paenibacillus protaetiae]|uniref:Aldolase n=1 Tax=Paenibacillus protaetiae TaxID=2509456 RepID=A0A4P6EYG2_9BACL|nr:aldolase [Paenibacillus protaetiae]